MIRFQLHEINDKNLLIGLFDLIQGFLKQIEKKYETRISINKSLDIKILWLPQFSNNGDLKLKLPSLSEFKCVRAETM